jgi:hypothetical protein
MNKGAIANAAWPNPKPLGSSLRILHFSSVPRVVTAHSIDALPDRYIAAAGQ